MKKLFLFLICFATQILAVDISNPLNLMFVGDKSERIIDVIDLTRLEVVHRFVTEYFVDNLLATPYAPLLIYTNRDEKVAVFYNLKTKRVIKKVNLPIVPRHIVRDTTGSKIGITDSVDGGFVLLSAYTQEITFTIDDFPPTTDVLFDPNDIDIYYSNNQKGTIGILDMNTKKTYEMPLVEQAKSRLTSPSRSLDGRYVYVTDEGSGNIFSLNVYTKEIFQTFNIGNSPIRPYTTPEGNFLYLLDQNSGRFVSIEQDNFKKYTDTTLGKGTDLVAVGRFDRMNLFMSSTNNKYYIYDNHVKKVIETGQFKTTPLDVQGSVDGKTAYVVFRNTAEVAVIDMETYKVNYMPASINGVGAYAVGLSNEVCH